MLSLHIVYDYRKKMIFDLEAGNLGDGSSPIEIRLVNVDRIFSRVNNIKILQRNLVECNNNTVLVGNPRFFVLSVVN